MPPWTLGWRVLTRPSSISGKPVKSLISCTGRPFSRSSLAVPPVEMSSTPSTERRRAKSARPVLSVTERMARSIFAMGFADSISWRSIETLALCVLRFAVAERPVFLEHLHQVDHDVFFADARLLVEEFGHARIEGPLHLDRAASVQRDLNDDDVVGALDVEVRGVVDEMSRVMLGDDLKAIKRRDVKGLDHRLVNGVADGGVIVGRLAFAQRDAD